MKGTKLVERFFEHGDRGELIPEGITFEELDRRYSYILRVIRVSWWCEGTAIEFEIGEAYQSPKVLPDRTGVLFIQPSERYGSDNAVVVNADGTERFRLKNPYPANPYYKPDAKFSFGGWIVENGNLALIVSVSAVHESGGMITGDLAYTLDTDTGAFLGYHEVR
jgi:hypothetical protein